MGERKVLNKYYPPDFDPSKIPRRRQPKNQQIKVRMMLPMSIRCGTCGNYIYKGTKFNSRKEDVVGETYLGIQIFRFYFKCTKCSAELTMKTDPQNSDYVVESGASRNFEPWRAEDEEADKEKKKKDAEEMGDAMKSLENRTIDSKREMDILAALDEMKSMRARQSTVSTDEMLEALRRTAEVKEKDLEEEDEALIKSVFLQDSDNFVRRLEDDEDDYESAYQKRPESRENNDHGLKRKRAEESNITENNENPADILTGASIDDSIKGRGGGNSSSTAGFAFKAVPVAFSIKRKTPANSSKTVETTVDRPKEETVSNLGVQGSTVHTGLSSLCAAYDSDSSE